MTNGNRQANLEDELLRGGRSLASAETLLRAGLFEDAVSRAYYALFHHVKAVLLTEGLQARSHSGVHHLLHEHFVRTGRLPRHLYDAAVALRSDREEADYATPEWSEEAARTDVARARGAVEELRTWLTGQGWAVPEPSP